MQIPLHDDSGIKRGNMSKQSLQNQSPDHQCKPKSRVDIPQNQNATETSLKSSPEHHDKIQLSGNQTKCTTQSVAKQMFLVQEEKDDGLPKKLIGNNSCRHNTSEQIVDVDNDEDARDESMMNETSETSLSDRNNAHS